MKSQTHHDYHTVRAAALIPEIQPGNLQANYTHITTMLDHAADDGVDVAVFPELCLTGYTCQDLFAQDLLIHEAWCYLEQLVQSTQARRVPVVIVGLPVAVEDMLFNCAAVIAGGKLLGLVPKTYLPNYNEFYEKRWFSSSLHLNGRNRTVQIHETTTTLYALPTIFHITSGLHLGVEICEDLWAPIPPSSILATHGANVIANISASNDIIGKHEYLLDLLRQQSARTISGYIYASAGWGESTQDVVYGGKGMICSNGKILAESTRFATEATLATGDIDTDFLAHDRRQNTTFATSRLATPQTINDVWTDNIRLQTKAYTTVLNAHPFVPPTDERGDHCEEILTIQAMGLAKRMAHTHCHKVVLGISGGLDSTLALIVCVKAFEKLGLPTEGIMGVTMPGFGTTNRTHHNAVMLMKALGVSTTEINIARSVTQHFADIGHNAEEHDVTYENAQARERTQILMDLANKHGAMVIGTGDMSELALGWATYNGDHISMYGVNCSVPKTLIKHLVKHTADTCGNTTVAQILLDVIDTPISPELIPADEQGDISQKTEDLVGPYELHDFFLYYVMRYGVAPAKLFRMALNTFVDTPTSADNTTQPEQNYTPKVILHWLDTFYRRFTSQQFKRSCLPDGPKVGSVSLSPRGDWRMASDFSSALWHEEIKQLEQAINGNPS